MELGNGSLSDGADRAAELASLPGVLRASWWSNCVPGRTELPMRVDDGSVLVIAEMEESAETPSRPPAHTAVDFRRHPRPSQGILSGRPTTGLLVVWITPRAPDLATQLRDWGDFVHIRHIAAAGIPGFTQISVYENEQSADPLFMHLYEFDSDDAEATYQTMVDFVAPRLGGPNSDEFEEWADWRTGGGRIWYCNTFNFGGETAGVARSAADRPSG